MKRWRVWLSVPLFFAILAAVLWFTPTNDYVILPGVTGDLNRMVKVPGGRPPARGRFLMVAVDLAPANLALDLYARLSPYAELVPGNEIVPPGGNLQQYLQESALEMDESHKDAEVAALRYLGYPAGVTGRGALVFAALPHTPAAGRLKPGDVIRWLNGRRVDTASGLVRMMDTLPVGSRVHMLVLRHGHILGLSLPTVPNPTNPKVPMVGVAIGTYRQRYVIPLRIHIESGNISGPSAGMMFSIQIIQELRPRWNLTHGLVIAGTGAIDSEGHVEPIGGVREKVVTVYNAGARVFLVPAANYADARREAEELGITERLRLIPVHTLAEAVDALRHL